MPAATCHDIFSKSVYRLLKEERRKEIPFNALYALGAQGPDFLFFSLFSFGNLKKQGALLHTEKIQETFQFLLSYQLLQPRLTPYVAGFICHYVLDAFSHPFIQAKELQINEKNAHFEIESEIDYWALSQQGLSLKDYAVHKHSHTNRLNKTLVAQMYSRLFQEVYGMKIKEGQLYSCLSDFELSLACLKPNPVKKKIIQGFESRYNLHKKISSHLIDQYARLDFLNLEHNEIETALGKSKLSYPEVYGKACLVAASILNEKLDPYLLCDYNGKPIKKDAN